MKHDYYDRDDGLLHCKVCNGGEGSLPSECPGRRMTDDEEEAVYAGTLDFKHGQWQTPAGVSEGRHQTFSRKDADAPMGDVNE